MPDLSDADRAQAVEAARTAGARPERAAAFARAADLSFVPRAPDGTLDAAALAAAMGRTAAELPELTLHSVVPARGGARRAEAGSAQGASPTVGIGEEARVSEMLATMQGFMGLTPTRDQA